MDVAVFVVYWCLMLFSGLAINLSNIEYGFLVYIFLWRSRPRSVPRGSMSDSPPVNEIVSFSEMLSSISLSIWPSTKCDKLR